MSDVNSILRRTCLIAATVVLVASCQRPEPEGAPEATAAPVTDTENGTDVTTAPTTAPPVDTSTPPTSIESAATAPLTSAPATTAPPTSAPATTAPPTTAAPDPTSPTDLILAFDGIRPFAFGGADIDIVPALVEILGDPVSDEATEYPDDVEGQFVNDSLEEGFVAPFGRNVCFANGVCVEFGAGSPTALQFVGWQFGGDGAAGLATEDGITIGSSWADHSDDIVVDRGACADVGYGSAEGIDVTLQSSGEPFAEFTDEGEPEAGSPDPADVTVIDLSAGDLPVQLFADC